MIRLESHQVRLVSHQLRAACGWSGDAIGISPGCDCNLTSPGDMGFGGGAGGRTGCVRALRGRVRVRVRVVRGQPEEHASA